MNHPLRTARPGEPIGTIGTAESAVLTLPDRHALATSIRARAQVFVDPRSLVLLDQIRMIAPSEASVLIVGDTGTGKELVARHVHNLSRRADRPFIAVNCGAFSETLVESELFGHEKFLDEIGDLPLSMQVKLLRVLQEHEIVRLGSRHSVPIDVRVIAATNVNLHDAVAAGHFRGDLFYRLNVVQVAIPALRERPGDILPLARYFIEDYRNRLGYGPADIDARAEQKLLAHSWPGNIRELENVIHHALLVGRHDRLQESDLQIRPDAFPPSGATLDHGTQVAFEHALRGLFNEEYDQLFEHIEDTVMRVAFEFSHRNQMQAAKLLGISRNVLRARLIRAKEIHALK